MEQYVILSKTSFCRKKEGGVKKSLEQDIIAFYNSDYMGGGNGRISGTIENLICTFKNDVTTYPQQTLNNAAAKLAQILKVDLPEVLRLSGKQNLRICVIPRAKRENSKNSLQSHEISEGRHYRVSAHLQNHVGLCINFG